MGGLKQSPNLDLLRAAAVLLVFFSHVPAALTAKPVWDTEFVGHFGVMIFFIHTSLVLSMSMARLEQQGERMVPSFYIRRAFRIYPLSILTVAVILVLRIPAYFYTRFAMPDWLGVWSNLLLFQNLARRNSVTGPLWSLPYEVQMYLVLPLIYYAGKRMGKPLLLGASGLVAYLADHFLSRRFGYPPLFEYAPWFTLGVALYFVKPRARLSGLLYCVWLGLFIVTPFLRHETLFDYYVTSVVFCLLFRSFREIEFRQLRRAAQYVARYSYGIYLSHVPLMWFAAERMAGQPAALRVGVFLVLAVATPVLLYHTVEKPFVDFGARLAARFKVGA